MYNTVYLPDFLGFKQQKVLKIEHNTYKGNLFSVLQRVHQKPPKTSVWWGALHGTSTHTVCSTLCKKKKKDQSNTQRCQKSVVKKSSTCGALVLNVPVSALPSHRHLCPPALPAAPLVEKASPNSGRTPGRSLA